MPRHLDSLPAAELCVNLLNKIDVFLLQALNLAIEINVILRVKILQIIDFFLKLNDGFFEIEDEVSHCSLRIQRGF